MGFWDFLKKNKGSDTVVKSKKKKELWDTDFKAWAENADTDEITRYINYQVENNDWINPHDEEKVHEADYVKYRGWGHNWETSEDVGEFIRFGSGFYNGYRLMGATPLKAGSIMLMKTEKDKIGRYLILNLERVRDPDDMFHAYIICIGYK